ncbi:MAG: DUF1232 domain-containing protein [Deltaproteobacteria bacterium]|nr:DUF1232 domain-containing protein [Deltaproteobacteria bacterium]
MRNMRQAKKAKTPVASTRQPMPQMQVATVVKDGRAQAEEFARQPRKLKVLLETAVEKLKQADKGAFKGLWPYLLAMIRLIRAFSNGKYKHVPWENLISIIVALAYFASPLDLIPDFLPGVGYLDDAMIVRFVYRSVRSELERFMEWESGLEQS